VKNLCRIPAALLLAALAAAPLSAADTSGLTGGTFLKIPVGGRMVGMAEAFTAVADDPYALAGNVAGISRNRDLEISFSHLEWFGDVNCEFFAVTRSFFKGIGGFDSSLGLAVQYLHVPDFLDYDDWGSPRGKVEFADYALTAGYGQKIGPFAAGLALKYVTESALGTPDGAMTFNLGLLYSFRLPTFELFKYKFIARPVDLGFLLENWGMGTEIGGYATPTLWKFGLSLRPADAFLIAADLQFTPENRIRLNTGCEYSLNNVVFFRFGYRFFGYETDSYTMGLGGRFTVAGKVIKADLSFAPASVLGNTLGLSVSMKYPGRISDEDRRSADMLYYKGIYYFTRGELDKAIEMWNETLKFDPEMAIAKQKIQEALRLKELELIEKTVEDKLKGRPPVNEGP
jgi:tetratricopeptide (TPR) repeat protein